MELVGAGMGEIVYDKTELVRQRVRQVVVVGATASGLQISHSQNQNWRCGCEDKTCRRVSRLGARNSVASKCIAVNPLCLSVHPAMNVFIDLPACHNVESSV